MANKDLEAFIQDHLPEKVLPAISAQLSRSETEGRRKDGSLFPMEFSAFQSKKRCCLADIFVGFTRDLSPQRKAEAIVESCAGNA